ncbi:uroporphyrinogen-III synthase [Pigmentiphaga aceris]|uniref:Uroporphyrinogen-III synthase n=1 Tax=Pigmentiphaga aceris TaxID=1940612 RepID=A0A5C0B4B4_9BURK|nr:uroporphyrinogen-III synthase [Pigmentiphaga aceris]QEI08100.1 uroporphyrinogen-III synthase [Pigmentiphaga aceris]
MAHAQAVILCRPAGQNEALAERLRATGREVLSLPALTLTASFEEPLPSLSDVDLVVFVSGNAARFFLDRRLREAPDAVWPAHVAAATVGPGSAAAVRAHPAFGVASELVTPPACAAQFDSEALWDALQARQHPLRKVLIVRGTQGRDWLAGRLRAAGVEVCIHTAYRRDPAPWAPHACAMLQGLAARQAPAVWLLTSVEGVDALLTRTREHGLTDWWLQGRFVVTHPRIAAHVTAVWQAISAEHGPTDAAIVLQTCPAGDDAVVAAIESLA